MYTKFQQIKGLRESAYECWEKSKIFQFDKFLSSIPKEQQLSLVTYEIDKFIMQSGFESLFNNRGNLMYSYLKYYFKNSDSVIFKEVDSVISEAKELIDLKTFDGKDEKYNFRLCELKDRYITVRPYFLINVENTLSSTNLCN